MAASRSGAISAGPKSVSWPRRGASGTAESEKPVTAAPGGRPSSESLRRESSVLTSRVGAGRSTLRVSQPSGSRTRETSRRVQPHACDSRRRARRESAPSAIPRNGSSVRSGHSSSTPSVKDGGGWRGTSGRGSRPRAISWSACPASPRRLATSAAGSFANSPTRERPQRASVSTAAASGSSFASGSGARNAASPPSGTTTGESGSDAATRAASLLPATPQRAGRDSLFAAATSARPRSRSSGKRRARPSTSRIDDALAAVLDARRDRPGRVEERLLRGPLARGVARAGEEVREERARLREREAGADAGAPRLPRRGDDARGRAVALADGDGLVGERRLAAQPRGEGEERHDEAGEAHDVKKISLIRISDSDFGFGFLRR